IIGMCVSGGTERDADASSGVDLLSVQCEGNTQRSLYALCHTYRGTRVVDAIEQNSELVSAKSRDSIFGPHARRKQFCDFRQQAIAHQMAESVIDDFEAVKVKEQHRENVVTMSLCTRQAVTQAIYKQ